MAGIVKFYMGSGYTTYMKDKDKENWVYRDALFFDTNTKKIYLNGETYTGSSAGGMDETAAWEAFGWAFGGVADGANNGIGTDEAYEFTFTDLAENEAGSIIIPKASTSKSGVMSSADKSKLDSIDVNKIQLKEDGKGLSTNDFTNEYKNKVDAAQENIIEKIKVNDAVLPIENKTVNIDIKSAVEEAVGATVSGAYIYKSTVKVASELPTSGVEIGSVYNIESDSEYGAAGVNVAWNGTSWDSLGGIFNIKDVTDRVSTNEANIKDLQSRTQTLEGIGISGRLNTLENAIDTITGEGDGSITKISQNLINTSLKWETID